MKTYKLLFFSTLLIIITFACSSSQESTNSSGSDQNEVYVFDDVSDVSTVSEKSDVAVENPPSHEAVEVPADQKIVQPAPVAPAVTATKDEGRYAVQLGAFSTNEKADKFIKDIQSTINYPLISKVNTKTGLSVVQVSSFQTREEAVEVRDKLKNNTLFKDAFIVTN